MNTALPPGAEHRIRLAGDLDVSAVPRITRAFAAVTGGRIVIDLTDATTVSAAFFGELAGLRNRFPHATIEVVGAARPIQRLFRLLRMDEIVSLR